MPTLCDPVDVAHQAPLSKGFSRQEYWSGLPCPSPGDLSDPGMEPVSLRSPALAAGVHWHHLESSEPTMHMLTNKSEMSLVAQMVKRLSAMRETQA